MKKKYFLSLTLCGLLLMAAPLFGQQGDAAFAMGSLTSSSSYNTNGLPPEGGGSYVGFNGDVLFKGHLGVQGEVNWRASQGLYAGQIPYRPIFWDFNAIYFRRFSKLVGAEVLGGIGGENIRFYSGSYNCDYYGNCTNYIGSNHFLVDVGGGLRFYVYHNFFVRPEVRFYIIPNNDSLGSANSFPGFSSNYPLRYGASVGYTFGGSGKY